MCSVHLKKKILGILAANIEGSAAPGLVASSAIARELNISLAETRSTLLSMREAGIIESDPDSERALITREGMSWLHGAGSDGKAPHEFLQPLCHP
jgi:DNA-binding IclR family transcriptional regulator